MSNSTLVTYTHIVKHKDKGRGGNKIQKIFVHHMAGNLSVKQCGSVFDNRQASAHYGVNGSAIGQYVDESDTSWHCGNWKWNQRSIGIELANDSGSPSWHVSDATIETAIKLIADICRRNDIKRAIYTGDMNGNICMHKWVCSTSCPGPYLSKQFERICAGVNKILGDMPSPFGKLEVDGIGGPDTVGSTQRFFGTEIDFVISGQNKDMRKYYPAFMDEVLMFDDTESTMIKALQWYVQVYEDGVMGPDTVKGVQKKLKAEGLYTGSIDGKWGSGTMKAWQKHLNKHEKAVFPTTHAPKPAEPVKQPTVSTGASSAASKIIAKAKEYAWAYGTAESKYSYKKGSAKTAYKNALKKFMGKTAKISQSDCGYFINTCVRAAGLGSKFLALPESAKDSYPSVPSTMSIVLKGKKIPDGFLKAGDIIRYRKTSGGQHTLMYYGSGKIAEAGREHQFPAIEKDTKKYNGSKVKTSSIQVIRAK